MRKGYDSKRDGEGITNLPISHTGILTGNYRIDIYGCWWEVKPINGNEPFWIKNPYFSLSAALAC